MFLALLLTLVPASTAPAASVLIPALRVEDDARAKFVALHEKGDTKGCAELWRAHPHEVLPVIDADLEGSLKVRETAKDKAPDMSKIAALHERALWGARISHEVTGHPLILDYTSSFVGWTEAQQKNFRGGQAAYKKARGALKKGDGKLALEAGRECLALAAPLGDWWGTAMGWEAVASAQQALGAKAEALEAFSYARAIDHDLGLVGDEYGALLAMVDLCADLDRPARGLETARLAIALGAKLGDAEGKSKLVEASTKFEAKLAKK